MSWCIRKRDTHLITLYIYVCIYNNRVYINIYTKYTINMKCKNTMNTFTDGHIHTIINKQQCLHNDNNNSHRSTTFSLLSYNNNMIHNSKRHNNNNNPFFMRKNILNILMTILCILITPRVSVANNIVRRKQNEQLQFLRNNNNNKGAGQGILHPDFNPEPYAHCQSATPNAPCSHLQPTEPNEHGGEATENSPADQQLGRHKIVRPTALQSSKVLEVNIPAGPIRIETGKNSNILEWDKKIVKKKVKRKKKGPVKPGESEYETVEEEVVEEEPPKKSEFVGTEKSHIPLRIPLPREKLGIYQNEKEAPCAAVSAKGTIKVVQIEAFKMKIDASTSCGIESIETIKKLGDCAKEQLTGAGKWGDDTMKKINDLISSLQEATSNFRIAEAETYKALRCVKRCGDCAPMTEGKLGVKTVKYLDSTQKALLQAKTTIVENKSTKKDADQILDLSPKMGPLIEDAKKAAKLALVQIGMMLDMAENVADGAWYSIWDDGIKAGAAAAKTYLKTIGTAGDYMKSLDGKSKNLKGWPKHIPRGNGKCTQARLELKDHSEELKKLEDVHKKRNLEIEKKIDSLGDKKAEEQVKHGSLARAQANLKREEASKKPDTCITKYAANLTSISRSGCMHGCSARKRQRDKYRSNSPNKPPAGVEIRNQGREEKAKRREGLIKRLGVLKWLEGYQLKDEKSVGTLANGTNTRENNPLTGDDYSKPAPGADSVQAFLPDHNTPGSTNFLQEPSSGKVAGKSSTLSSLDEKTKQKFRDELKGELQQAQPDLVKMANANKPSEEEKKFNSPTKTSKTTRDILKMVIHNANLPFTYNDADAIPYELVKRDKLVLDQLVREGLVLDNRDRVMEEKVESLDPSTILDTNYKCTEYCPKTLGQVLPGVTAQDEDGKTWIKTCTLCCQTIIPKDDLDADLNQDSTANRLKRTKGIIPCNGECHARKAARDLSYLRQIHTNKEAACDDLRKWSPCMSVCERSNFTATGIDKSGCLNGCREALLKGIPSSLDCAQYCDETVDQVFLKPETFGFDIFNTRKMPFDALGAKNNWVKVCTDSCRAGFGLREELFGKTSLHKTDFCVHCPNNC